MEEQALPFSDARVRTAHHDDIDALHRLVETAYRGDSARRGWTHEADLLGGQRTDIAKLTQMLVASDETIGVIDLPANVFSPESAHATTSRPLIGCVHVRINPLVQPDDRLVAYLGMLAVDPEHQARGLARRLIDWAEQTARDEFGARAMQMTVIGQRRELIQYYERRGYLDTGERQAFPLDDPRFGLPKTRALYFVVLEKRF